MALRERSLMVLEKLLGSVRDAESRGVVREYRFEELLRDPFEPPRDWYMYADSRFNDALGIALTSKVTPEGKADVWTQGSTFTFSPGDKIYDSEAAYGPWAPSKIKRCFSITLATPVAAGVRESVDGRIRPRSSGYVEFDVLAPNANGSALEKIGQRSMSQDDFVRLLIGGPWQSLHSFP